MGHLNGSDGPGDIQRQGTYSSSRLPEVAAMHGQTLRVRPAMCLYNVEG